VDATRRNIATTPPSLPFALELGDRRQSELLRPSTSMRHCRRRTGLQPEQTRGRRFRCPARLRRRDHHQRFDTRRFWCFLPRAEAQTWFLPLLLLLLLLRSLRIAHCSFAAASFCWPCPLLLPCRATRPARRGRDLAPPKRGGGRIEGGGHERNQRQTAPILGVQDISKQKKIIDGLTE